MTTIETPTLSWPPVPEMLDGKNRYAGAAGKRWSMSRQRVTNFIKTLDDGSFLEEWRGERRARGLLTEPTPVFAELFAEIIEDDAVKIDDHIAALRYVVEHGSSKHVRNFMRLMGELGGELDGANLGRRYHEIAGAVLCGVKPDVLPMVTKDEMRDVDAILAALTEHHLTVIDIERIVMNRDLDYAGRYDYLFDAPDVEGDDPLGDLKTTSNLRLAFPGYRNQQACYAHATHMVDDAGDLVPIRPINKTVAFIIHIIPGTAECNVYGCDLRPGARAMRVAAAVREQRRGQPKPLSYTATLDVVAAAHSEVAALRSRWCLERIAAIKSHPIRRPDLGDVTARQFLVAVWPPGVPLPSKTDGWTGDDLSRVIAAIHVVENEFELPFAPRDPATR